MCKQQKLDLGPSTLKRRVFFFLAQRGISWLSRISIEIEGGRLTFRGTVRSFYERQLCLACRRFPGVEELVDELEVEVR